jgi:hypothetical protein
MTAKRKTALVIALLAISVFPLLLLIERHSIVGFYAGEASSSSTRRCPFPILTSDTAKRRAVANYYLGYVMDSEHVSHVSHKIIYHRLMADLAIRRLLRDSELDGFFEKTPCSFRKP